MTAPQSPPRLPWSLERILLLAACVLFVIASLAAGGWITNATAWSYAFGGFAAWVLSGAVLWPRP